MTLQKFEYTVNTFFVCFSNDTCPPCSSLSSILCAVSLLSKFPRIKEGDPTEAPLQTHFPSPLLPQVLEGGTGLLEGTNNFDDQQPSEGLPVPKLQPVTLVRAANKQFNDLSRSE